MFTKPTFENNIYMKLIRWIYIFLSGNLCFLLVNITFFFAVVTLAVDPKNLLIFGMSLLPVGSGAIALLALVDEFKKGDLDPVKTYFKKLRIFGFRGLVYWLIGWFGTVIGIIDIFFIVHNEIGKWLIPFFSLLIVFFLGVSINSWYFQIRNPHASIKNVLRISIYYDLRKWYASLLNVGLFLAAYLMMLLKPQFGFIITPILFIGLIYLNLRKHPL